eukprot:4513446-Amphidinium_carterae.1
MATLIVDCQLLFSVVRNCCHIFVLKCSRPLQRADRIGSDQTGSEQIGSDRTGSDKIGSDQDRIRSDRIRK